MKILTYNIQHCMSFITRKIDIPGLAEAIRSFDADIVGLNEMRMAGEDPEYTDQLPELARLAGYPYWYFAKALDVRGANPYGNGLMSRYPILFAETVPVPDPADREEGRRFETRCLLHAKLDVPGGLDVFVIHFGLNPSEQVNAVKTVTSNLTDTRAVLMGDFNVSPEDPVLTPIRSRMFDTAEHFAQPLLSYPSDKPSVKIDYIFHTPDLTSSFADIPALLNSDHRPYVAKLAIGD